MTVACGGAAELDSAEDDVTSASAQLYTVRRDERRCAAPMCGGFWATAGQKSAVYVSDLDLSMSGLDAADQEMVRRAPAEELLFKAKLSAKDARGLRQLQVKDAWRGMPGIVPAANDRVFAVAPRTPQRTCVAAPCNNQIATDAASGKTAELSRVSVQSAARAFVDQDWLQNRLLSHGALAAAHLAHGQALAAGTEVVLDASQVWLHLPDNKGPCAAPAEAACGAGDVEAFTRTADRCLEPVGCVHHGICSMMLPSCPDGYVASTWTAAPNGCAQTACDPAWVVR